MVERSERLLLVLHEDELLARDGELLAQLGDLVLEDGDDAQAAVHRVLLPRVGLVRDRLHGVLALRRVDVLQDAQDVGHAEQLVHVRKSLGLVRREVGRERAVG